MSFIPSFPFTSSPSIARYTCCATPPDTTQLTQKLRSTTPTTQILALLSLPQIPAPASVSLLHSSETLSSPHLKVRLTAVATLGKLQQLSEFRPLLTVLRKATEEDPVRAAAASALGELLQDRPEGFDHVVREVITALLHAISTEDQFMIRYAAIVALGDIGDSRALPSLISLIKDGKGAEAAAAVEAAAQSGTQKECWEDIVQRRTDSDEFVRAAVARALKGWGDDQSLRVLRQMAAEETSVMVRAMLDDI